MRSFLSTLRSLRAVDFPSDQPTDLSMYGLDHPRLKVSLYLGKDNAEKDLLIGKEAAEKQIYVQGSGQPTVYTVSDWVMRDLNKNLSDFRDKTLLAFDRDTVTAVEVARKDGGHFKLVRGDDKQWRVEGAGNGKPEQTVISQYIGDLHDLAGYEIVADQPGDLAQFGLDQPLLTVTVSGNENKPVGTVLLASRQTETSKKDYTAMTQGGQTVFLIRDYLYTRLDKRPQDFVEHPKPTVAPGTPNAQVSAGDEPEDEPAEDEPADTEQDGEPPAAEHD
jgi:hypothetical protein